MQHTLVQALTIGILLTTEAIMMHMAHLGIIHIINPDGRAPIAFIMDQIGTTAGVHRLDMDMEEVHTATIGTTPGIHHSILPGILHLTPGIHLTAVDGMVIQPQWWL